MPRASRPQPQSAPTRSDNCSSTATHRADHRLHDQALGRVLPVRDRLAQGYYDQPQLTDAVVARMLGLLNAEQN